MCLDHTQKVFGGLYCCAKLGWNRCSNFDNKHVSIFSANMAGKIPIHAPFCGIFGWYDPYMGSSFILTPKGTFLLGSTSYDVLILNIDPLVWAGHDSKNEVKKKKTRMWANAQCDGRPSNTNGTLHWILLRKLWKWWSGAITTVQSLADAHCSSAMQ